MKKILLLIIGIIISSNIFSQGSENSLILNGSNQDISIPNSPELNPTAEITLEAWFRHTQIYSGVGTESIILKSYTSHVAPYYQYGLTTDGSNSGDKHFRFFISVGGTLYSVSTPNDFYNVGEWYHISGTYDGAIMKLYINGDLISSIAITGNIDSYNTGIEIGKLRNYAPSHTPGEFDELKIWNKALTQNEIREWMCKKITNLHPYYSNLMAYYNFNSGSGATLVDQTSNSNDGTMVNSPVWQTSSVPIGDDQSYLPNVSIGSTLNLTTLNGNNLKVNVTSGTADALYIYKVESLPNITTPPSGLDQLSKSNYFGVKAFGSSSLIYEVVYDYSGHSGVAIENNLRLCTRDNNSTTSWVLESATLDVALNTLSLGGQTGTEFIIGSISGNTLPVEEFDVLNGSIVMYPNPAVNVIIMESNNLELDKLRIFNYLGQDITNSVSIKNNTNSKLEINIRELASGLYYIKNNQISKGFFKID